MTEENLTEANKNRYFVRQIQEVISAIESKKTGEMLVYGDYKKEISDILLQSLLTKQEELNNDFKNL